MLFHQRWLTWIYHRGNYTTNSIAMNYYISTTNFILIFHKSFVSNQDNLIFSLIILISRSRKITRIQQATIEACKVPRTKRKSIQGNIARGNKIWPVLESDEFRFAHTWTRILTGKCRGMQDRATVQEHIISSFSAHRKPQFPRVTRAKTDSRDCTLAG